MAENGYRGKAIPIILYLIMGMSYIPLFIWRNFDDTILFEWRSIFYDPDKSLISIGIFVWAVFPILLFYLRGRFGEKHKMGFLLIFSFLVSILFWNVSEINPDASRYFWEAKYLEMNGIISFFSEWGKGLVALTDFPSMPLMYGIIFRYIGEERIFIQISTTLMFVSTIYLTYLIGKRLWNGNVGLVASAFLVSSPYLFSQVPLFLIDIPLMFLLTLAIYFYLNFLEKSFIWAFPFIVCINFLFFSKITIWFSFAVFPFISFYYYWQKRSKDILLKSFACGIMAILSLSILFFLGKDFLLLTLKSIFSSISEASYPENILSFFCQINPVTFLLTILYTLSSIKRKDSRDLIFIGWFLIPFLILFNSRIRYSVPNFPAIALMAAIFLENVKIKSIRMTMIAFIVTSSLVMTLFVYLPYERNAFYDRNLLSATEYIEDFPSEKIEIYVLESELLYSAFPVVMLVDYYSGKKVFFHPLSPQERGVPEPGPRWPLKYSIPDYYLTNTILPDSSNIVMVVSSSEQMRLPENVERILNDKYRKEIVFRGGRRGIMHTIVVKVYIPLDPIT